MEYSAAHTWKIKSVLARQATLMFAVLAAAAALGAAIAAANKLTWAVLAALLAGTTAAGAAWHTRTSGTITWGSTGLSVRTPRRTRTWPRPQLAGLAWQPQQNNAATLVVVLRDGTAQCVDSAASASSDPRTEGSVPAIVQEVNAAAGLAPVPAAVPLDFPPCPTCQATTADAGRRCTGCSRMRYTSQEVADATRLGRRILPVAFGSMAMIAAARFGVDLIPWGLAGYAIIVAGVIFWSRPWTPTFWRIVVFAAAPTIALSVMMSPSGLGWADDRSTPAAGGPVHRGGRYATPDGYGYLSNGVPGASWHAGRCPVIAVLRDPAAEPGTNPAYDRVWATQVLPAVAALQADGITNIATGRVTGADGDAIVLNNSSGVSTHVTLDSPLPAAAAGKTVEAMPVDVLATEPDNGWRNRRWTDGNAEGDPLDRPLYGLDIAASGPYDVASQTVRHGLARALGIEPTRTPKSSAFGGKEWSGRDGSETFTAADLAALHYGSGCTPDSPVK